MRAPPRAAIALLGLVAALIFVKPASAQTVLSGNTTTDNLFWAYLSTSPTTQGTTALGSGNNWSTTYALTATTLTAGQNYWLQILGRDVGGISGFLGTFQLAGSDHLFANGSTALNTNTTNWQVGNTGFGQNSQSLLTYGTNGVGPWGTRPGIDANAEWIWSNDGCVNCDRYFSTQIMATSVVPEPSTWIMLATGLSGLGFVALRRRREDVLEMES